MYGSAFFEIEISLLQSYLTAPEDFLEEADGGRHASSEDTFSLPIFGKLDPKLISNAPAHLVRGAGNRQYAWGQQQQDDDSGQMPSDIQVVREENAASGVVGDQIRARPEEEYERMFSENRSV